VDYGGFRIIYLPHDMLIEYRQQYRRDGARPSRRGLKVIRMAGEAAPAPPAPTPAEWAPGSTGSSELSQALAAAVARAAAEQNREVSQISDEIEAMVGPEVFVPGPPPPEQPREVVEEAEPPAGAKREAGDVVLPRREPKRPAPPPESPLSATELSAQEQMAQEISSASRKYLERRKRRGEAASKPLRLKRRGEPRSEAELAVPVSPGAEPGIPADEDEIFDLNQKLSRLRHEPIGPTVATYAAFVVWCVLFLAVLSLFAYRLTGG
jgi:hypothetical protein